MKKKYIIVTSLIACILLYFVEQVILVDYAVKTLIKVLLFTGIPYCYVRLFKKSTVKESINYEKLDKSYLKIGVLFGIISFIIIVIVYKLLGETINLQEIANELQNKSKITPGNFIFVGIYITIVNSFLEEFFFRGFIFLNLYEMNLKKSAYVYSSLLFALYHISIFKTWFDIRLIGLALVGLLGIGFIFDRIDTKSQNFINSWIVHVISDSAIILIGLKMFEII